MVLDFFLIRMFKRPSPNIVKIERNKMNINNLELDYPIRNDEIGSLSKEIKNILGYEGRDEIIHKDDLVKFT